MEVSFHALRVFNRLLRRPIAIVPFRNVSNTAVKEEVNSELLNSFNQDVKAGGAIPVFRRALLFPSRVALQDEAGTYTYAGLHHAASELSKDISAQLVGDTERTIAYMCPSDASHVVELEETYEQLRAHNEGKNIFKLAGTPTLLIAVAVLGFILMSLGGALGVETLAILGQAVALCALVLLVAWAYSRITGNLRDIAAQLDELADNVKRWLWDAASQRAVEAAVGGDKKRS